MYFVRQYKSGADHDVRQKRFAVYHCDVCGYDEDVDITGRVHQVQFNQPRRCPKCKSMGKHDRLNSIKKEIETLTATRNNIDVTIEQLMNEMGILTNETQTGGTN